MTMEIREPIPRGPRPKYPAWALLVLLAVGLALGTAPSSQEPFTIVEGGIVRGSPGEKRLALIFTGGEFGEGTGEILGMLAELKVPASFFLTGDYLSQDGHAELVRRMLKEGHYVGPHSDSHPLYCSWEDRHRTLVTRAFFAADLERNMRDLRSLGALAPGEPVFFIPPSEWYNREQALWAAEMGITLFNFTPGTGSNRDWAPEGNAAFVSSHQIASDILKYESREEGGLNGFLLLLHLGSARRDKMVPEMPGLFAELLKRGYSFVRVDSILSEAVAAP